MKPYIVCAANKLSDGTIILGIRHWDMFMHQIMEAYMRSNSISDEVSLVKDHEQGFVDQFGKFYNRKEAYKIAEENGQIRRSIGYETDELYSEHLY